MIVAAQHTARSVFVSAFHWTKGKEDAAFAVVWPDFLPPHCCLASWMHHIVWAQLSVQARQSTFHTQAVFHLSHTPFIHRILAEKAPWNSTTNDFFHVFILHLLPYIRLSLSHPLSFFPFSIKTANYVTASSSTSHNFEPSCDNWKYVKISFDGIGTGTQ
jgi:hypothetical protein